MPERKAKFRIYYDTCLPYGRFVAFGTPDKRYPYEGTVLGRYLCRGVRPGVTVGTDKIAAPEEFT